jgi:hypothetical protein
MVRPKNPFFGDFYKKNCTSWGNRIKYNNIAEKTEPRKRN